MAVDGGCVLTDSPISLGGADGLVTISGAELQSDGSSVPLTVESGGAAVVLDSTFRSTAGDITAVSVSEGGSMTVGGSRLVGVDGSADPLPCDGVLPNCVGEHDGSVVVEGMAAVTLASPLVCDVETGTLALFGKFVLVWSFLRFSCVTLNHEDNLSVLRLSLRQATALPTCVFS
jgi:hypothetical protein